VGPGGPGIRRDAGLMAAHGLPLPGSTDCHVHAFGNPAAYPLDPARSYTPGLAETAQLAGFLDLHGLERVVLVQPSVYGTDNRCTLDAAAALGDRARAVLVLDPGLNDAALPALRARGARGVRLNLHTGGQEDARVAAAMVERFAGLLRGSGWHLQVFAGTAVVSALGPVLARLGLPVVLDHFGLVGRGGMSWADAAAMLLRLAGDGGVYIKLSAPQRVVPAPEDAPRLAALVRNLARAAPERLLWGSDWPHTARARKPGPAGAAEPFEPVDDRRALARIADWVGEERAFRRMLVTNPAALYGFAGPE
jgi:predicted TIM-barrel fold metal-dependent hydrolase